MKQRKTLNKQTDTCPLAKESGPAGAENGKPAYASPQVNVAYVELERAVAASVASASTPTVTDWKTGDAASGDISIL